MNCVEIVLSSNLVPVHVLMRYYYTDIQQFNTCMGSLQIVDLYRRNNVISFILLSWQYMFKY
jgi:hypothetical protein